MLRVFLFFLNVKINLIGASTLFKGYIMCSLHIFVVQFRFSGKITINKFFICISNVNTYILLYKYTARGLNCIMEKVVGVRRFVGVRKYG